MSAELGIEPAETTEAIQLARVLASFVRAEFEAPVHAVTGFIDLVIEDAARDSLDGYKPDLDKLKGASVRLEALVAGLLESTGTEMAFTGGDIDKLSGRIRHDLRTPITAIIGYGELLSEVARDDGVETLAGTLDGLTEAAKRLLGQIDAMVDLLRRQALAPAAQAPSDPPQIRLAVDAIRAVLFDGPSVVARVTGRILVVDDNVSNLDLLARRLSREGHEVTICESGQAALGLIAEKPFDLVLLDLIMPGLNGIDVLRQLRAHDATRALPVIMVSAMDEIDGAVRCIEAGADDFLSKPLNPVLLQARMNAALERKLLRDREIEIGQKLGVERERSEALLRNVLPVSVVERLRKGESVIADHFDAVTILFCDLVGFTRLAARLDPEATLDLLNGIFSTFDQLAAMNGLEKIKTIGDAYMVAGGLPSALPRHVEAVADMAMRMPAVVHAASTKIGHPLDCRIGMHTGPAVAGIIGTHKFVYDVWGDTVNTASRMERYGPPGRVHITAATRMALGELYTYDQLAPMSIKGKGMMDTFLIR